MKTNELIRENWALRESLTPENKEFYERLLLEVRGQGLLKNDRIYEETLLAILQDVKVAQDKGISAEAYLGKSPEALAHEIVAETPRMNWKSWAIGPLIFLAALLLPQIVIDKIISSNHTTTVSLLGVSLLLVLTFGLVPLIFKLLTKTQHFKYLEVAALVLVLSGILTGAAIQSLTQHVWTITF